MKIYLAGPMNGIPYLFHAAEAMLTAQGHEVFSPARADIANYGVEFASLNTTGSEDFAAEQYGFSRRDALREDLSWICAHADAVALLPGWRASTGATAEHATALALNPLLFWSNSNGWVDLQLADIFTQYEHNTPSLPMSGTWMPWDMAKGD